jgi:pimeloyl-ACP methyl ester carboxylesterase
VSPVPLLDVPGTALCYSSAGDGIPLVLVHGSAVDARTWDGVAPDLARDYRVITYDRRGYGRSVHKPVRDHRLHARDLIAVLEQVAAEPAVVVGWSSGGNVALAVAASRPELFRTLVVVEAPFHGQRHMNRAVLRTALRLKAYQLRGRPVEALEEFLRFGSALRSGGNAYDQASEQTKEELRRYPRQVLAEWDPHPFGVMHEHVPVRAVARAPVAITWILGGESSPWLAGLEQRVSRRRPDIKTVVVPGASHLVHLDHPDGFTAAIRAAAGQSP